MMNKEKERRKFLKHALGIGTLVWLTPTIMTVSANTVHAQLSGGDNIEQSTSDPDNRWPRRPRHRPRPWPVQ